jgi:hypothetical protein
MQDEQGHIIAECARCSFRFDTIFGLWCPRCRTEAVRETFRPVDELRTALACFHDQVEELISAEDYPRDYRLPKGEDAQIYELKRRFRL